MGAMEGSGGLITPITESELDEVMSFLRTTFKVSETHPMFQAQVLRWKCFAPHPFWEGSRGYALRHKGDIAAFGCMVPCRFLTGAGGVKSCCMIDWAASQKVPGAGIMLYRHIQTLTGTMINIGGSDDARSVLPRIGFKNRLSIGTYTRVLRPWQHLRHEPHDWKLPLRWARDCRDWLRTAPPVPAGLCARRITSFGNLPPEVFPDALVSGSVVCERTVLSLDYALACPAAQMEAYVFHREGAPCGYFLLSRVAHQCRVADLWIRSSDRRHWAEAYATASALAGTDPRTTQITTAASTPLQAGALCQAGYRRAHAEPVFVLDPAGLLGERGHLIISFLENDAYYWRAAA